MGFGIGVPPTKLALQHSSLDYMVFFFVRPREGRIQGKSDDMATFDERLILK